MKLFDLEHSIYTLIATALFGVYGFIGAVFFFIGREVAQAEYRAIHKLYGGHRANMPDFKGFDVRLWDFHSWFWNLLLPIIVGAVILLVRYLILGV